MKKIHVAHVTGSITRKAGGLFESVRYLSQKTAQYGVHVEVVGLNDEFVKLDEIRWAPIKTKTFRTFDYKGFGYAPNFLNYLLNSDVDIIHLHGIWQYPAWAVLEWARLTKKPYIISVHGMLEPWALARSKFKKWIANCIYQRACLHEATCLRSTADSESVSIRAAGFTNPIVKIPNGVVVPENLLDYASEKPHGKRRILFLSRLHPKKGLLNLVQAWAKLKPTNEWELVLIGPDEVNHKAEVFNMVHALGLQDQIRYGGEVWDDAGKWRAYSAADVFVLPTFSENFGLVIAEALGCGLPAITTRGTPWQQLETDQCGWWIDFGVEPLVSALRQAMATPKSELISMGLRGRQLVIEKYGWDPLGQQMAETYEWLLGKKPRPQYVFYNE